jgi:hypothetical protein
MTRKTVSIAIPKKPAAVAPAPQAETHADHWVRQDASPAPAPVEIPAPAQVPAAPSELPPQAPLNLSIPRDPSLFDAAKVSFIVPQLVYWQWTLSAIERNLKLFKK